RDRVALHRAQALAELARVPEAVAGRAGEASLDDGVELRRDLGVQRREARDDRGGGELDALEPGGALEEPLPRERLPEDDPEREQVGARARCAELDVLRRHVAELAATHRRPRPPGVTAP